MCKAYWLPISFGILTRWNVSSVTEISETEELDAEICKIFPGEEVSGPEFIRSVRGPMLWVRLMPTGGVSPEKENIYA
jgi:2-dehydro-3-deoxyphosphogluconate aldolase/(4S)-4-hydroxy-2-oxoglutarate aldolase